MTSAAAAPSQGVFAALWMPTDRQGRPLRGALARNIAFLRGCRVTGLLALGSTGEFPRLGLEERKSALSLIADLAGAMPVIANISDIRPAAVAELGRHARKLGLAAAAIMAPGFYPVSQEDLLTHCLHAADAAGLPMMLYNFPELTGTRIGLETIADFAARAPLAGIKHSGGEFAYHRELIALGRQRNFAVFSGADTRLPEVFALGASGCVGGLVNIAPELMVHLYRVCAEQAPGEIEPAFSRLKLVGEIVDRMLFPLNVAAGMEARGLPVGEPKALVSARSQELYAGIVADLRGLFARWGMPAPAP